MRAVASRQRQTYDGYIKDRDIEIERLRGQISHRSSHAGEQRGLEDRLRALTESLIEKQTQIELLNAEKTSLQLQLESEMEKCAALALRYQHRSGMPGDGAYIDLLDDDGRFGQGVTWSHGGIQARLRELGLDSSVRQGMRLLAIVFGILGTVARRVGRFLRAYPHVIVIYVVLYIFFTFFVMSRSAPDATVNAKPNGAQ
eukprot:Opistho-2@52749